MKALNIALVNSPVVYSPTGTKDNDFRCREFVVPALLWKYRTLRRAFSFLHRHFGLGEGVRYGVRSGSRWPFTMDKPPAHIYLPYPFMLGYTASYLKANGMNVCLMDGIADGETSYKRFLARVKRSNPDIVIMESFASTREADMWFAKQVSEFAEAAVAGPLVAQEAEQLMTQNPHVRYWLKGEYILSSLKMCTERKPGIYESEVVTDLDSIPFPFRDYPEAVNYTDGPLPHPQLQILGSKGCPFKCSYCLYPQTLYKGNVTLRSPEKIAEEIKQCVERQGYRGIYFDDDTFNMGNERISKLCDYLKDIGLPWGIMARLDCSPLRLYDKMIDSGCVWMKFGVETFDPEVSRKIKKGLQLDNVRGVVEYLSGKYPDVTIHLTMMKNLPGQTEEMHRKDMEIIHGLGFGRSSKRTYQLSSCIPFPGTAMYKDFAAKYGLKALEEMAAFDGASKNFDERLEKLYD
ncbi:MAG: radical SAM protein [Synergistaceae bacterium]|nr:radical SAM protein [Synergistaceae bacterium]